MRIGVIIFFILTQIVSAFGQRAKELDELPMEIVQMIEDLVAETDAEFDFNALVEELQFYYSKPLDLKNADREDLQAIQFLSQYQIDQYFEHVRKFGPLISLMEFQTIPGFDDITVQLIRQFVSVGDEGFENFQIPLFRMHHEGKNELFLRMGKRLPEARAFTEIEDEPRYEGNADRYYARYRHAYYNKLSYGVTMEKDVGEALFKKSNPHGFDFYSAHWYLKSYRKWLKSIALGDYSASMGQGLIMHSGFGGRKGAQVDRIARSNNGIRPYRSVDENNFLRGAAVELNLFDGVELMAFASLRKRDANLIDRDTLDDEQQNISSLQTSGLHRSANEIEDEKSIDQMTFGGRLGYQGKQFHVSINALQERLSKPLLRNAQPYNLFYFNGTNLSNISADYRWSRKNYALFGEVARSSNGGIAYTNGLQIGLSRIADLSLLYRSFNRNYQSLNGNPFAEGNGATNETGFYTGLSIKPNYNWAFTAYYDLYRFNWLRFGVSAPSLGRDFRGRITWRKKRKFDTYIEARSETKQVNVIAEGENEYFLGNTTRRQLRWNLSYKLTKSFTWRSRIDIGEVQAGPTKYKGISFYQDMIYKPITFPLHFTARFAVFDTDGYLIRFYNYENNLLNSFSIPPYYGKGFRYYVNLRYKGIRKLTLEARWAQTYRSGFEPFNSGVDGIRGNTRNEIGFQIKYTWGK